MFALPFMSSNDGESLTAQTEGAVGLPLRQIKPRRILTPNGLPSLKNERFSADPNSVVVNANSWDQRALRRPEQ